MSPGRRASGLRGARIPCVRLSTGGASAGGVRSDESLGSVHSFPAGRVIFSLSMAAGAVEDEVPRGLAVGTTKALPGRAMN